MLVNFVLDRLQLLDVFRLLRQERIEHRLALARGIEPALDAEPFDQLGKAKGPADDAN